MAVVLSFFILIGYQYFFVKPTPPVPQTPVQTEQAATPGAPVTAPAATPATVTDRPDVAVNPQARDITVDTPLYETVINEQGGGLKSFVLKQYRNTHDKDSGPMQLITGKNPADLPVLFSLDNGAGNFLPIFQADKTSLPLAGAAENGSLVMHATTPEGLQIQRTLEFNGGSYLINIAYKLVNSTDKAIQVSPALSLANQPFAHASQTSKYLFSGPAAYINGELVETKPKKLVDGPIVLQGKVSWTGYVDNYFMTSVVPTTASTHTVTLQGSEAHVRSVISEGIVSIPGGESKTFTYSLYFGPKKLKILQTVGYDLAGAVNFGWFDLLAKPML